MTRCDFCTSAPVSISCRTTGTTCQETPNLSFSQPQGCFSPPLESFSQNQSTSSCEAQLTTKDIACEKENCGPPFRRTNSCLLYTSPSPRDRQKSRMPSSA